MIANIVKFSWSYSKKSYTLQLHIVISPCSCTVKQSKKLWRVSHQRNLHSGVSTHQSNLHSGVSTRQCNLHSVVSTQQCNLYLQRSFNSAMYTGTPRSCDLHRKKHSPVELSIVTLTIRILNRLCKLLCGLICKAYGSQTQLLKQHSFKIWNAGYQIDSPFLKFTDWIPTMQSPIDSVV